MPKAKMPKTLYVYEEEDRDANYFVACGAVEDCAERGERRTVGVYELKRVVIVSTEAVVSEK